MEEQIPVTKKVNNNLVLGIISVVVVGIGITVGWFISGDRFKNGSSKVPGLTVTENEAGVVDNEAFPDSAEGVLEAGGISGEGTHHLEREGGVSKNVYLTSTVIDLESFVGKKVTVWGQTSSGKKAGWLMDVGKIKVVE